MKAGAFCAYRKRTGAVMSDDKTIRGRADADRINVGEDYEVAYWKKKWNVTAQPLRDAVKSVGPMSADVARKLGK
jgi:hypothetical protein